MTDIRATQLAAIAVSDPLPSPPQISQLAVISVQSDITVADSLVTQLAVIFVTGNGRKLINLENVIQLDCWQPCNVYGTQAEILLLGS